MLCHPWPGNVRELYNTVMRAVLWTPGELIDEEDAKRALFVLPTPGQAIMERPLGKNFVLQDVLDEVARHYIDRAMRDAGGTKTKAAELLGFNTYQTLFNWMKRYEI